SCHWKNKDGYLFFMPQGVLFGFKKPTVFFPVESIASIAIGYVTRLTFDLSIRLKEKKLAYGASGGLNIPRFRPGWDGETVSFEFTMIEHSEYRAINAYIEKLSINDSSMSEARRAPVLKSIASSTPSDNDKEDQPGTARMMEEDDDEENDHDFVPSDNGDEPLEYDSDASSDQEDDDDNEYHSGEDVDELDE
ncbi:histone chaperone Rttp106-like-domain-containing protein, partial [Spinellus fusiger]